MNNNYTQLRQKFQSEFNFTLDTIKRVDISSLTPEIFVEQYQKTGTPVVITGLLEECDWNLDYLCDNLGDQKFLLRFYGHERYKQDKRKWKNIGSGIEAQALPFTEYAAMLRNHQAHENDV